jgi:Tfp pilus assembly protein PilV
MRVFCAALIVASLAGTAYAQEDDHVQRYGEKAKEKSQSEINADKAATRAYQNSLKNIPDKGPVDPWGSARSADTPKAAVTTPAKTPDKTAAKTAAKPASKSAAKAAPDATKAGNTADQ